MKSFFLSASILFLFSCHHEEKNNQTEAPVTPANAVSYKKMNCVAGTILDKIVSQTNSAINFNVYCPNKSDGQTSLPVVYFFDPHADGKLPLEKYKALADEFHVFLVGCNSSENGMSMEQSLTAANAMISDCRNRLPVNERLQIISGFSGGSKVACITAMKNHSLSGLIACSGSVYEDNAFSDSLNIVAMAGQKDFNYHEMTSFNKAVSANPHIFIETDNTHEWPPADAMRMAFQFELLMAVKQNRIAKEKLKIQEWQNEWKNAIHNLEKKNEVYMLHLTLQNAIAAFQTIADVGEWQNKFVSIEKSDAYKRYVTKQRNLNYQEKEMQKMLNDAFANQNLQWWEKEIADLKTGATQTSDPLIASLNGRLLGYIGIAAYSYSKQLVEENHKEAGRVLAIYRTAEPDNAEAWFLSAVYNANNNMNEQALSDFQKALEKGFKEQSRINNYPRLKNLIAP